MIEPTILKENFEECYQDLDAHVKVLEEYIHKESLLQVNSFCRKKGEEIQYKYNSDLKPQFTSLKDNLRLLFSLCVKIQSPGTKNVDIHILTEHIKSQFINNDQKLYLLEVVKEGNHEIKRHNKYCQELRVLTKKIETKIDNIKLLNYFIDESYVVNSNIQIDPIKDTYNLINDTFDEYYFWDEPLEGILELGDLNYYLASSSKKLLNSDDEIWSELIKLTYGEKECDPFLSLYTKIQKEIESGDSNNPISKKRRIDHV